MPDTDDDIDAAGLNPAERRILQDRANRADELQAKLDEVEWKLATSDLGLNDEQRLALQAVHKGDRDPDAVRATAARLGFTESQPAQSDVPAEELATQKRMIEASTGAVTRPGDKDAEMDARLAAAKSEAEFMSIYRESGRPII